MIKAPVLLQELRRKIYVKAKSEDRHRFWGLYVHICKQETLREAYRRAKQKKGAPGIDGVTFADVEAEGVEQYLEHLRTELITKRYQPSRSRKVKILKADGKSWRELSIPTVRDRIVQGAVRLVLEPIFEAGFQEGAYGYRPKRQAAQAVNHVVGALLCRKTEVIDLDIAQFFDTVRQDILLSKIACRVQDKDVLHLIKLILKSSGKRGLPQGGPLSPLLSNVYLTSLDKMLEGEKYKTRYDKYTKLEYGRWADDMVILINSERAGLGHSKAILKKIEGELHKLGLSLNAEKTRVVDLTDLNQSFSFLGFDFRRYRSLRGKWAIRKTPKLRARIKLQRDISEVFRKSRGMPIQEVVKTVNPKLRGWVNHFRIGNSGRCFNILKIWVEKKVRKHVSRIRKRRGFDWKRWSTEQLYRETGLYNDYQIRYSG